jgi:hypothetical protein
MKAAKAKSKAKPSAKAEGIVSSAEPLIKGDGVLERSVCVVVNIETVDQTRKIDTDNITVDADKALIRANKMLFDSDELRAINQLSGEIRRYLYNRCLPSPLKQGVYLLPVALLDEVDHKLQEYATEREQRIDTFCTAYDALVDAAKERLRSQFDEDDYPAVKHVRQQFQFSWRYMQFGVPGKLQTISSEMYRREQEKMQRSIEAAAREIQKVLRARMAELVSHMVDRLTPSADGKKKIFRDTMLDNINDFLLTFDARNLTDDAALKQLVDKARKLTKGVDPTLLREDDTLRDKMQKEFAQVKKMLDGMLVDKPSRAIQLED